MERKRKREDRLKALKNLAREFYHSKTGMTGLVLLIVLVIIAVFFPYIGNSNDIENWDNLQYWEDYPKKTPPCWAAGNVFRTIIIDAEQGTQYLHTRTFSLEDGRKVEVFSVVFDVTTKPPQNINLKFKAIYNGTTRIFMVLKRPDGEVINLTKNPFEGRGTSPRDVFGVSSTKFNGTLSKQLASYVTNPRTINRFIRPWIESLGIKVGSAQSSVLAQSGFDILFRKASPDMLDVKEYLTGTYNFTIAFVSKDPNMQVSLKRIVLVGGCYGIIGTDKFGRDLYQALLYGVKWALIIGLLASIISTLAGGIYGVVGGYAGGIVDEVMLRIAQVVYSIPVLPLLILLAAILRPSIWNLVGLLIVFGWPGIALVTRSMSLQLKEETYVEAVRAMGAGHLRIMFLYILPQILPYLFASIALSVPGAVLTEAGVSFLGLGDPTVITWGKILNEAQNAAATINGYWWWVIPPGIMITLVGMTFILIGQALDTILNPRLKR